MAKRKIKLSIIILSWNTKELLEQCLESVVTNTQPLIPNTEIIVVDNDSTDGSVDYINGLTKLRTGGLTMRSVFNKENLGFAKGNNVGIAAANGEYIMVLNSDTIVKPKAIDLLVNYMDQHPEVDIVGPKLLNADGTPQANCGRFPGLLVSLVMLFKEHFGGSDLVRRSPGQSGFVDWLTGAAFMARKEVFKKIGKLDENIFMYMEEVEWFYRANLAGFKTYFYKDAEIIHLGRGSAKSGKKEPILNIYKGLIYYYQKHKSPWERLILKILLKSKALLALTVGYLKNDNYLKETYAQAFKIS